MTDSKEHILRSSLLLFLQKSYRDVTMKELVAKTGMSKGAFYHYFTSKEELFKEIVTIFFSMGKVDYSPFPQKNLNDFINAYLVHIENSFQQINSMIGEDKSGEESFNFFFIMFEAVRRFPEFLELESYLYKHDLITWETVIDNAKQSGEVLTNSSSRDIANLFLYCTDGVFIRVLNNDKQVKYTNKLAEAFSTVYNNIKK